MVSEAERARCEAREMERGEESEGDGEDEGGRGRRGQDAKSVVTCVSPLATKGNNNKKGRGGVRG